MTKHNFYYIGIAVVSLLMLAAVFMLKKGVIPMQDAFAQSRSTSLLDGTADDVIAKLPEGLYTRISTTRGDIIAQLFYQQTPVTVASFIQLAEGTAGQDMRKGPFYDGLTFHRVEPNFVVQGGDPKGNGTGGPGYNIPDEIVDGLAFDGAGVLGMANAGPDTNGSQFFITLSPQDFLTGRYTVFGRVVNSEGQKAVEAMKKGDAMQKVVIIRKGSAAEKFEANWQKLNTEASAKREAAMMQKVTKVAPGATKSASGLYSVTTKAGTGKVAIQGQKVKVHYKGTLLSNGQVFDSSYQRNEPIEIQAGIGQVIPGWDEVLLQMLVGEKRIIVLPPQLAYGDRGAGNVIPPKAWLVFEMERID
jgi:cyclophilin family peptidyl-prolyl cis-trans isomerase